MPVGGICRMMDGGWCAGGPDQKDEQEAGIRWGSVEGEEDLEFVSQEASGSMCACVLSSQVMSDSSPPHGLQPTTLLGPWDSPCKGTGGGCYFLLQGIFSTHGLNPCLLYWQADSLLQSHLGSQSK